MHPQKALLTLELNIVLIYYAEPFASDQFRRGRPAPRAPWGGELGEKAEDAGVGCPYGVVVLAHS